MAREIKNFSAVIAANSGASTIYTVPAGRSAKLTFNTFLVTLPSSNDYLKVNGTTIWGGSTYGGIVSTTLGYGMPGIQALLSSNTNQLALAPLDETQAYAWNPTNSVFMITKRIWYMGAGQAVTANTAFAGGGANTISYDFQVIEEY